MKKNKFSFMNPSNRTIIFAVLVLGGALFVLHQLTEYSRGVHRIMYSTFLEKVDQDQVKQVHIAGQEIHGVLKDGTRFETVSTKSTDGIKQLRDHNVIISAEGETSSANMWYLIVLGAGLSILAAFWYSTRQSRGNGGGAGTGGNIFSMGKSKARIHMPSTIKDNFNSVAGAHEAKEELHDIVDYLKNPEKYKRLGAKMTRGVLLVGAPGNGKTLLARAVAGEANCPFLSISGSDFIEVFVGVGAARVRDLFAQARKHSPSIIFIDEIDAVGRQRGSGLGGGHDEREQTLNQLLTEMDGFQTDTSVVVMAATNRPDVLDNALLRPGRFDRRVDVPYPDLVCREQILNLHAKGVKIDPDVDMKKIARGTTGFSGADLANLINEAAIQASKQNQDKVVVANFEEARDKILLGKEHKTIKLTDEDRKLIAFHEAGHALMRILEPSDADPLYKITIVPRGRTLGVTHFLPEREKHLDTKDGMMSNIKSATGGRAAEALVFNKATSGSCNDFEHATAIARRMVCAYGMSDEVGHATYFYQSEYSQATAEKIDNAISRIVNDCYQETIKTLTEHRNKLDKLANTLLEKETMYADEVYDLLEIKGPEVNHRFS